jgi:hypothetical protein
LDHILTCNHLPLGISPHLSVPRSSTLSFFFSSPSKFGT